MRMRCGPIATVLSMVGMVVMPWPIQPAALAWDGTSYRNLVNGEYSGGGTGWTKWTERGTITVTYTSGTSVRLQPNNANGGIFHSFNVASGHQYAFQGRATLSGGKDWVANSMANCSWAELHLDPAGTKPATSGSDYTVAQICKTDRCTGCEASDNWSRTFPACCNQALSPSPYLITPGAGVTQLALVIKLGNTYATTTAYLDTGKLQVIDRGAVVGRIRSSCTGAGIAGATVTMTKSGQPNQTAATNANGYWEIDNCPVTTGWTVNVSAVGYGSGSYGTKEVTGTSPLNCGDLSLNPSAALVSGNVKDDAGNCLSAATVAFNDAGGVTSGTDCTTANYAQSLSAGTYDITAAKTGYATVTRSGLSLAAGCNTVDFTGENALTRNSLTGIVHDTMGGVLAGARVVARNTGTGAEYAAVTGGTGIYTIITTGSTPLPQGSYKVTASKNGYDSITQSGIAVNTGPNALDFTGGNALLNSGNLVANFDFEQGFSAVSTPAPLSGSVGTGWSGWADPWSTVATPADETATVHTNVHGQRLYTTNGSWGVYQTFAVVHNSFYDIDAWIHPSGTGTAGTQWWSEIGYDFTTTRPPDGAKWRKFEGQPDGWRERRLTVQATGTTMSVGYKCGALGGSCTMYCDDYEVTPSKVTSITLPSATALNCQFVVSWRSSTSAASNESTLAYSTYYATTGTLYYRLEGSGTWTSVAASNSQDGGSNNTVHGAAVGAAPGIYEYYCASSKSGFVTHTWGVQTVAVSADTQPPTITCPVNVIVGTDAGQCYATCVNLGAPTTSDNCGVASVTNDAPAAFPQGTTVVTWTVTDTSGNTATCTQAVTVNDTENPTIACPANVTVSTDAGLCYATNVSLGSPISADNCGIASITNNAPSSFPKGTTMVTWTATDTSGKTATCAQTVTVNDPEAPVISSCGADQAVSAGAGCQAAAPNMTGDVVAADNCTPTNVLVITQDPAAGAMISGRGDHVITIRAADASGNYVECTKKLTLNDVTAPVIALNGAQEIHLQCPTGTYSEEGATATDDCDGSVSVTIGGDTVDTSTAGTYHVTYDAGDLSGNPATQVVRTVIVEEPSPVITDLPQDLVVECQGDGGAPKTLPAIADFLAMPKVLDGCDTDAVIDNDAPDSFPVGTTTVTWTATDPDDGTVTASRTVTVQDTRPPTLSCPPTPAPIAADDNCKAAIPDLAADAASSDECCVNAPMITQSPPAGTEVGPGSQQVTLTATDCHGLTATCVVIVSVVDSAAPVITGCPAAITVPTDAGQCAAAVTWMPPTASDNCGSAGLTSSHSPGAVFTKGTTTVTYTATDTAGNSSTCSFAVTVSDQQPPEITGCPESITVSADAGQCLKAVSWVAPAASDNCAVASLIADHNPGDTFAVGMTTVTYTATDTAVPPNTSTCSFTVTVTDDEPPMITACPPSRSIPADLIDHMVGVPNMTGEVVTSDNCPVTVTQDPPAGTRIPPGDTTVVMTAADGSGHTATCSTTITVYRTDINVLTLNRSSASAYVKPGEYVFVNMDVSSLQQKVNGCQALIGYSSTYLNAGGVAPGGGPWTELIYESWAVPGELDTAIGVRLEGGPDGTQADGTVAVISLLAGTSEGTTHLAFRADGEGGYATLLSGLNGQPVWPNKVDNACITIDGTAPSVTVLAPDGGEYLRGGHSYEIRWTATDANINPDSIKLEYFDGTGWVSIASQYPDGVIIANGVANSGSYTWTPVPVVNISNSRIRVTAYDFAGNSGSDESDGQFTIDSTAPTVTGVSAGQGGGSDLTPSGTAVQGVVNIAVAVSDNLSGVAAAPVVTVTPNGGSADAAPCVNESPAGTFNYTWMVTAATPNGQATITVSGLTDRSGNVATSSTDTFNVNKNQVTGTVSFATLSSSVYSLDRDVVFVATHSGGTVLKTWMVGVHFTNDGGSQTASGPYVLTDVPGGLAFLSAKTAWDMRRKQGVTLNGEGQATAAFTLSGGDLDGNNYVNILDYSVLRSHWNSYDAAADINGDAEVQLLDYSIIKSSWFQIGDPQ